jgi:NTE family protein
MRVLILGGGGTLGAFSAGALRALERIGWQADALIGSSAGSINLLRSFVGGADEACAFWTSLSARELLQAAALHNVLRDGLLSPSQLHQRVDADVDFERVLADPRAISFIVVDLQTGKVAVRGNRTEKTAEDLRHVAHGSFSLPPLLPPVHLDGQVLADGGFLRNAPLESALELGATEIVYLCNVQVAPRDDFRPSWAPRTLLRYANIYFRRASNIGYADAPIVESHYHGVPFLTIAPPSSLRLFQAALPTGNAMKKLVAMGEERARRAIEAARDVAPEIGDSRGVRPSVFG